MKKILINASYGGFWISDDAKTFAGEESNWTARRDNPKLIQYYEENPNEMGDLKVVEIPDDVDWVVEEYDGCEWVAERHRTWS